MDKSEKQVKNIRTILLDPAFEMIREYIVSQGQGNPEIVCKKDSVEVIFNDNRGKICQYGCWINDNGKVYREARRRPETKTDFSGCDAFKVTPQMIFDDFVTFLRFII